VNKVIAMRWKMQKCMLGLLIAYALSLLVRGGQAGVQQLLVERLAGGDHREYVLATLDDALHHHGFGVVVLEELLHFLRQLRGGAAPEGVHAHGIRKLDEVGIRHTCVRVALVVKEICVR
jgi:hypothetical protein